MCGIPYPGIRNPPTRDGASDAETTTIDSHVASDRATRYGEPEMSVGTQCRTILLVDDEPFILENTARLLRSAGHTVHTCEQWTGVAATVHAERPDMILMDFNMPSIKGDDLCRILKRTMVDSDTPIVIFSSEPEHDLIDIVARSGADGYIKKNVAGHVLLSSIENALSKMTVRHCV